MLVFHGTTLRRAQRIIQVGPDPKFVEPGGRTPTWAFYVCLPFGPFETSGRPERYALLKVAALRAEGRDEGPPALLQLDIPDEVVDLVVNEEMPLSQGFLGFDVEIGLDALLAVWPRIPKRIILFREVRDERDRLPRTHR